MIERPQGRIFTFYSYKGGTGRTMALANVAWILASRGKRVLVIDWDLEAPGLHRFFAPFLSDPTFSETDGLIDFLARYVISATKEPSQGTATDENWYRPYADIKRFAEPLQWQFPEGGSIDIVGAGRQNASYGTRVTGFDWDRFYRQFGGGAFLDESIQQMKLDYDYILIDSRTGISDTSGICTIHMPDALVVFYTLNNQSIEGASSVAAHVVSNRQAQSGAPFPVWSMATRVELAEKDKLQARRLLAREKFTPFLETLKGLDGQQNENYWGEMEVLYDPYYAYEEVLATIADQPGLTNSVLAALERLTARLTNGQIVQLGKISETKRSEALALYSQIGKSNTKPDRAPEHQAKTWDIFIAAGLNDSKVAERLYYLLGSNYEVFYDQKTILPGQSWQEITTEALKNSRAIVMLLSKESIEQESKWESPIEEITRQRLEKEPSFKLIPVQLDPDAIAKSDFLKRFQHIQAYGTDMQELAVLIRRSLGESTRNVSEREQAARVKAEFDQALEDKTSLTKRLEQLQQEIRQLSSERAILLERSGNLERAGDMQKRLYRRKAIAAISIGSTLLLLLWISTYFAGSKRETALREMYSAQSKLAQAEAEKDRAQIQVMTLELQQTKEKLDSAQKALGVARSEMTKRPKLRSLP